MTWDGRPPNPEVRSRHWIEHPFTFYKEVKPEWWLPDDRGGFWLGLGSPRHMHANGYRYIGPASPDDARELRRLREGIEAILDMPDGGWLQALRELLKGTP